MPLMHANIFQFSYNAAGLLGEIAPLNDDPRFFLRFPSKGYGKNCHLAINQSIIPHQCHLNTKLANRLRKWYALDYNLWDSGTRIPGGGYWMGGG